MVNSKQKPEGQKAKGQLSSKSVSWNDSVLGGTGSLMSADLSAAGSIR